MPASRDLPPLTTPFFSRVFKNNFRTTIRHPSKDTNLSHHVAIVTGSNTGLGFESARQLLSIKLSRLILAVRSSQKGGEAAKKLKSSYQNANIEVWELDMSSYGSLKAFAQRAETQLSRLDIVILNAGVSRMKFRTVPSTGHEETIQVNHLSTTLLTVLILPVLKTKSPSGIPGRLTIINSAMSYDVKFKTKDHTPLLPSLDDPQNFSPTDYYGVSKLLNQVVLWKLSDYVSAKDVIVNMVDPGWTAGTQLARDAPCAFMIILKPMMAVAAKSVADGAAAYIDACVMEGPESHGCFIMGWEIKPFAPLLYTAEGKELIDKVWRETMDELSFVRPLEVLDAMSKH